MSSAGLDAVASIRGGEGSVIARIICVRANGVRRNQPEDYTVPRSIHGGAATPASERELCLTRKQPKQQGLPRSPPGPLACAISRNIRTGWSRRFARTTQSHL